MLLVLLVIILIISLVVSASRSGKKALAKFEEWRTKELQTAKQELERALIAEYEVKMLQWRGAHEANIRADAIIRSSAFEQSYSQTERHHVEQISESRRQSRRAEFVAWAALLASLISLALPYVNPSKHPAHDDRAPSPRPVQSSSPSPTPTL